MYFTSRIVRMVHYGLADAEIATSLDISIQEVRDTVRLMSPLPIDVLNETGKTIQHRSYLVTA